MRNQPRTRTEQAYRAFKQQVIAQSNPLVAPIDRDAVVRAGSMVFAVWRNASELDQPLPPDSCVIECQGYAEAYSLRAVEH